MKQLSSHYNKHLNESVTFYKSSKLELKLEGSGEQSLIKVLQNTKLPVLKEIYISYIYSFYDPDSVNKFLSQVSEGTRKLKIWNTWPCLGLDE